MKSGVEDILLGLKAKFVEAIREDANRSYEFSFKQAVVEQKADLRKAEAKDKVVDINWNLQDVRARDEVTSSGLVLSDDFYAETHREIQRVIARSFGEQRSIPYVVNELSGVVQTESWKLTRIARTEIINASNEGRLAGFRRVDAKKKLLYEAGQIKVKPKENKYTLIVAHGARTCDAHKELASRIPKAGMKLDDLKMLQQEIGSRHGMSLSGNSLLHPNQRTVLSRVVK